MRIKKGFTLAEIMIVLAVIGILTAILLPVAYHSAPNENVMKFKKGHNALLSAIRELVNSDKYYLDGDLGVRANGILVDGTHDGDKQFFCATLADLFNTKDVSCSDVRTSYNGYISDNNPANKEFVLNWMDDECKKAQANVESEITTMDDIFFYRMNPEIVFGSTENDVIQNMCFNADGTRKDDENKALCDTIDFSNLSNNRVFGSYLDANGLDIYYMHVCMDIDGMNNGEDPFGYGIRTDGKVMLGKRANEWLQKSIQEKE